MPLQPKPRDVTPKSVQDYIDEGPGPTWVDNVESPRIRLTPMQRFIWLLAASGKFFEGMVIFTTGIALPLLSKAFHLNTLQHGVVASVGLFGILIGAVSFGSLADHIGRKRMFIIEMTLFCTFLIGMCVSPHFDLFIVCLFGLGVALGSDYPVAHLVISESMPSFRRGQLVLSAFAFQALGATSGALIGYLVLHFHPQVDAWRIMYAICIVPAILVLIGRFFIPESPHWLSSKGKNREAEKAILAMLSRQKHPAKQVVLKENEKLKKGTKLGFWSLFRPTYIKQTILASVPWFLQDLGTYGIGIFTPVIMALAIGHKAHSHAFASVIHNDMLAAKGAVIIDMMLIVGIIFAISFIDRIGRIALQVIGFIGCAVGLAIAALSTYHTGTTSIALVVIGFMLFNFMNNLGPNAMTYVLCGEVFPTEIRGRGAGFAATFGKIGACLTAFLFPLLLASLGQRWLLAGLVITSLLGALITWAFRVQTVGILPDSEEDSPRFRQEEFSFK